MAHELTRLDASRLFQVGYVKSLVYGQRPQNEAELHRKITVAFAQISVEMLSAMWCNLSAQYELPRLLWWSCCVLMCWDRKVVSLVHVCIPLTGSKRDSFLQHFQFFLSLLKRNILYYGVSEENEVLGGMLRVDVYGPVYLIMAL
jgi:hypothetical protein